MIWPWRRAPMATSRSQAAADGGGRIDDPPGVADKDALARDPGWDPPDDAPDNSGEADRSPARRPISGPCHR